MIQSDSFKADLDRIYARMEDSPAVRNLDIIKQIKIKNTIRWLTDSKEGQAVMAIANICDVPISEVAEKIIDEII